MEELALNVRQAGANEFWLIFVIANGLSAACFYYFVRFFRRYRIMEDTPTSLLRSAAQGYNEFEGHAKLLPGEPIVAPLTKHTCVWYWYKVEEKQSHYTRGRSRTSWHLCETGTSDGLFSLAGQTGSAIIDPDDAEVIPSISDVWYGTSSYPQSGPGSFVAKHWLVGGRYRYSEKRIHENDSLYVLGQLNSLRRLGVSSLEEKISVLLQHWKKSPVDVLRRFDMNRNQVIDAQEWATAVVAAKKQIAEERPTLQLGAADNLIEKPLDSRQPYVLSAIPQEKLITRYQYRSWFSLSLFFISGSAAVWMFNIRFI